MGSQQQFCLRWNNHQTNVMSIFEHLYKEEHLVDVTLACDGLTVKAHKVVLSACSPYFQALFVENPCPHPIVFLKDVQYHELRTVVDFMYRGEVNVSQEQLNAVLETAEALKVRGLAEVTTTETGSPSGTTNGEGDSYTPQAKINTGNGYNESVGQQVQSHAHHHHIGGGDYHHSSHMLSSSSHHHSYLHVNPRSLSPPLNSSGGGGGGGGASASPKDPLEGGGGVLGVGAKRCLSPTAKRRKAKPRKRLPENTIPSDHDDSDALDLSTASPDLCMDTQDNPYDEHLTHIKMEPMEEPINDKDYNSNQNKCVRSPVNPTISGSLSTPASSSLTSAALRMPIIPKLQPLSVSVNCPSVNTSSHMPSTSAVQSSIIHQDIRRLCQYSRQSQQHKPTWTEEDMVQALEAVQSGRLTYALAARKFDIPKATLHYYVILMKAVEAVRSGRMTAEIAAIKYNVRTSILLDCLFGRQSSSTTIPGVTAPPSSAADSAPLPPPPLLPSGSSTSSSAPTSAPNLASTSSVVADTKSSAYK